MIPPLLFFAILVAGTIAALLVQLAVDRIYHRRLVQLARDWQMHYAPDDRFNLAPRVAERLSLPGASDVRVVDLIYGMEKGLRRYVFAAHYTRGVVRWKRRARCVASLSESKHGWSALKVAPADLSLIEQYRNVADENVKT
jgi:hypothetical protein